MPPPAPSAHPTRLRRLDRLRQWRLVLTLAREAGINHVGRQAALTALGSLLDIAGLGVGVTLLLQGPPLPGLLLPAGLGLEQGLLLLVGLMLVRGGAQALVAIRQERLRSGFTDRLRQQLLGLVVHASGHQLEQLGRGELMGLLMSDISRSVLALDQAIRALQAAVMLLLYGVGVLVVGRQSALPLLLALLATGMAALLQRSGSWRLGRLQSQLNGALQRTVGDGLHGLKAVRAATAEDWLLRRFADNTASFRQLLRENVRRQSLFQALRDALVVLVVGAWLVWGRAGLPAAAIATTLLLAYRSATALSAVVQAQRLCLGALPGYEELCQLRRQLQAPPGVRRTRGRRPSSSASAIPRPGRLFIGRRGKERPGPSAQSSYARDNWLRWSGPPAVAKPRCWIGSAVCWRKTAAAGSWPRTRDRWSFPVQRVPFNCASCSPTPHRRRCCLKPACARICCWISTKAPSRSKPGWIAWGYGIFANGPTAWTPACPWRWITSPVARFTGWACCEPGCATARWKCSMNPPPFWMRNRASGSARSLGNAPRNGWCW